MHRFLTAFVCLATLAMAQNVLAVTPRPIQARDAEQVVVQAPGERVMPSGVELSQAAVAAEIPSSGTILLFVTGLAGLAAVGRPRATSTVLART